jgi:glutamate--cysteine ligase
MAWRIRANRRRLALVSLQIDNRTIDLSPGQPISEADAEGWLPKTCFKHGPPGRIGIELEYVVHARDSVAHVPPDQLRRLYASVEALPLDSRFTVEPGGQVELSSRPAERLGQAIDRLTADLALISEAAARHSARLVGVGIDPLPPPPRLLEGPRYAAMAAYLSRWGRAGAAMMRSTASVQVNVEAATPGGSFDDRWRLLYRAGPVLSAAFATSPTYPAADPHWAGWAGLRQAVWQHLDPSRCLEPPVGPGESVPEAWARYVLDARVLAVRRPSGDWTAPPGVTFRRWLREGPGAVPGHPPPSRADLAYHLTTLFPPVRARGHLEVRYLDEQPGRWWRVPPSVISMLVDDADAADAARAACEPLGDGATGWRRAARVGLRDPEIRRAAGRLLTAAAEALDRAGEPALADLTATYSERRPHPEEMPC